METLCRVCGSPGAYDIFGKIPRFLNTDRRDLWQQPICKMVSDVTGIPISKNDGLPERICSLCISYLKHAVSFRNRAVETRLSLLSAAFVTMKDPSEDFGIVCDNEENEAEADKTTAKVSRVTSIAVNIAEIKSPEIMPKPSCKKLERFFDYEEKTFVEDDMTQFEGLEGIEINHPEVFRERKCGFCQKKFMLEDTYDDHLDECLYRTLIEFIKDSNYIVKLKDDIAISNHEFIRRMVFAIQRVNKAIKGMQLPAAATLIDDTPSVPLNRRSETPPRVPQYQRQPYQRPPQQQQQNYQYHQQNQQKQQHVQQPNYQFNQQQTPKPPQNPPQQQQNEITPKVMHFFQQSKQRQGSKSPLIMNAARINYIQNHFMQTIAQQTEMNAREGKSIHSPIILQNQQSPHSFGRRLNSDGSSAYDSLQTPSPTSSSGSRKVVCKICDKTFMTITHLDTHMIREHT